MRVFGARGRALRATAAAAVLALAAGCGPGPAPPGFHDGPHAGDIVVGSDEKEAGSLAVEFDFEAAVELSLTASLGGFDLYTAAEPGFDVLVLDEPGESFYVLEDGTEVVFEIVSIDAGVAVKLGDALLDEPGDSAVLGAAPDLHLHPEWQLAVPAGTEGGEGHVSFRLTAPGGGYGPSGEYVLTLTAGHAE